jgi:transcriptional regulator with XRE-family HTH domain
MSTRGATGTDQIVGARITALRKAKGLSQTALGTALGVTFQQVQKYEKGLNRVGAGRIQVIAKFFDVPVAMLFGDDKEANQQPIAFEFLNIPGAVELLKAFAAIEDVQLRRDVLTLARTVARMRAQPAVEDADNQDQETKNPPWIAPGG